MAEPMVWWVELLRDIGMPSVAAYCAFKAAVSRKAVQDANVIATIDTVGKLEPRVRLLEDTKIKMSGDIDSIRSTGEETRTDVKRIANTMSEMRGEMRIRRGRDE